MTQHRTLTHDYKHVKGPGGPAFSGWMGLLAGLAIGLTVALGVFLYDRDLPPAEPRAIAAMPPASTQATEDYTFPDMLPTQEVRVPTQAEKPGGKSSEVLAGDVILQAGWFRQPAEAERLQAKLAQYGVDAKIQRFALEDETWYRVRIGPIATVRELRTLRAKLSEAEVEATPMTRAAWAPLP